MTIFVHLVLVHGSSVEIVAGAIIVSEAIKGKPNCWHGVEMTSVFAIEKVIVNFLPVVVSFRRCRQSNNIAHFLSIF